MAVRDLVTSIARSLISINNESSLIRGTSLRILQLPSAHQWHPLRPYYKWNYYLEIATCLAVSSLQVESRLCSSQVPLHETHYRHLFPVSMIIISVRAITLLSIPSESSINFKSTTLLSIYATNRVIFFFSVAKLWHGMDCCFPRFL